MKKLSFCLVLILFVFTESFAQAITPNYLTGDGRQILSSEGNDEKTIGSPYINEEFMAARISIDTNKLYGIRYNSANQEMEVQLKTGDVKYLDTSLSGVSVSFLSDKRIYKNFILNEGNDRSFLLLISPKNFDKPLLELQSKKFVEGRKATTSYEQSTPAKYVEQKPKYFIGISETHAIAIPKKVNDFETIFPKFTKQIKNYIKKNKPKTSRKDDLIDFVNFLNTL